jgi:hypothetical protein
VRVCVCACVRVCVCVVGGGYCVSSHSLQFFRSRPLADHTRIFPSRYSMHFALGMSYQVPGSAPCAWHPHACSTHHRVSSCPLRLPTVLGSYFAVVSHACDLPTCRYAKALAEFDAAHSCASDLTTTSSREGSDHEATSTDGCLRADDDSQSDVEADASGSGGAGGRCGNEAYESANKSETAAECCAGSFDATAVATVGNVQGSGRGTTVSSDKETPTATGSDSPLAPSVQLPADSHTLRLPQHRLPPPPPQFVAAASYAGLRPGYVYTMRSTGLGYYTDAPPSVAEAVAGAAAAAVTQSRKAVLPLAFALFTMCLSIGLTLQARSQLVLTSLRGNIVGALPFHPDVAC